MKLGNVWADFGGNVECNLENEKDAITLQTRLINHFGGAQRAKGNVWACEDTNSISK